MTLAQSKVSKRYRERKIAQGLCSICTRKAKKGKLCCSVCLKKKRDYQKSRRLNKKYKENEAKQ